MLRLLLSTIIIHMEFSDDLSVLSEEAESLRGLLNPAVTLHQAKHSA